jgi:glucosyl-3-phosphoglycerate synthase
VKSVFEAKGFGRMDARAVELLALRTTDSDDWVAAELLRTKTAAYQRVSVILPALNEEATVGTIVRQIRRELMTQTGSNCLVDELVVLDSGSTDRTAQVAADAGATVIHRDDVLTHIPTVTGKGEAMWRGLAATTGDIVVFVDADLRSFSCSYIVGLLGPLLNDPLVHLVKAVYERPLVGDRQTVPAGGGRVTELVARPLLNLNWPQLAGIIQPLAGEYAARRSLLEQLPFSCGYGVDFGLLLDTEKLHGVRAIAQVDLGVRVHRHHDTARLGRMAAEIMATAATRASTSSTHPSESGSQSMAGTTLTQYERDPAGYRPTHHEVTALERPPLATVPEYIAGLMASPLASHPQST